MRASVIECRPAPASVAVPVQAPAAGGPASLPVPTLRGFAVAGPDPDDGHARAGGHGVDRTAATPPEDHAKLRSCVDLGQAWRHRPVWLVVNAMVGACGVRGRLPASGTGATGQSRAASLGESRGADVSPSCRRVRQPPDRAGGWGFQPRPMALRFGPEPGGFVGWIVESRPVAGEKPAASSKLRGFEQCGGVQLEEELGAANVGNGADDR